MYHQICRPKSNLCLNIISGLCIKTPKKDGDIMREKIIQMTSAITM